MTLPTIRSLITHNLYLSLKRNGPPSARSCCVVSCLRPCIFICNPLQSICLICFFFSTYCIATTACLFTLTGDRGLRQERRQQKSRGLFSYIRFIGESKDERSLLLYNNIVILQNYLFTMYVQCSTLGRSDLDLFNYRDVTTRLKMLMREPHHQPGNPGILLAKLS